MPSYEQNISAVLHEITSSLSRLDHKAVVRFVETLDKASAIFIAGTGRTGLVMRCFAMRLMQVGYHVHVVGDVTTPAIQSGDLLLVGSGSGHTASLVGNASQAGMVGATVALVTAAQTSPLADVAHAVVHITAPTPKKSNSYQNISVQPLASLFEQALLIFLDSIVMELMGKKASDSVAMFARHANLE